MDHSWMSADRLSDDYENVVTKFLQFSKRNLSKNNTIFQCRCVNCSNHILQRVDDIRNHLNYEGIYKNYTRWTCHGEIVPPPNVSQREEVSVDMDD